MCYFSELASTKNETIVFLISVAKNIHDFEFQLRNLGRVLHAESGSAFVKFDLDLHATEARPLVVFPCERNEK